MPSARTATTAWSATTSQPGPHGPQGERDRVAPPPRRAPCRRSRWRWPGPCPRWRQQARARGTGPAGRRSRRTSRRPGGAGSPARTGATRASCPWPTGRRRGRSRGTTARERHQPGPADGTASASPPRRARDGDDPRRADGTNPPGIGLPGLPPGVARRVDDVVDRADRELDERHRQRRGERRPPGPTRDDGHEGHDEPVEDRREGMDESAAGQPEGPQERPPRAAAVPAASDVDELVEVGHQVLDQPVPAIGHLGADPGHERPERDGGDDEVPLRVLPDRSRAARRQKRTPVRIRAR